MNARDLPGIGDTGNPFGYVPPNSPDFVDHDDERDASVADLIEACREARDWIELAETSRQQGDVRAFVHRLGCAIDILKSVKGCAE